MAPVDTAPAPTAVAADINQRIAQRVRQLRTGLDLSLEALSSRCNVSRSMLSLVERGESSPTAVVLEKIASGLGVSLATLFDDPVAPAKPVSSRQERQSWRDPQSGYVRRNISPPNFPTPIQIVEVELPAGARVAYETTLGETGLHRQIWVQQGSIEVTVGRTSYCLAEDDCLATPENEPTTYHNRSRKPARYYVVLARVSPALRGRD